MANEKRGWVTSLIAVARDEHGRPTQVVVGLARDDDGDLEFVTRIGEHGKTFTMSDQSAREHIENAQLMMTEKLRMENQEGLGKS